MDRRRLWKSSAERISTFPFAVAVSSERIRLSFLKSKQICLCSVVDDSTGTMSGSEGEGGRERERERERDSTYSLRTVFCFMLILAGDVFLNFFLFCVRFSRLRVCVHVRRPSLSDSSVDSTLDTTVDSSVDTTVDSSVSASAEETPSSGLDEFDRCCREGEASSPVSSPVRKVAKLNSTAEFGSVLDS